MISLSVLSLILTFHFQECKSEIYTATAHVQQSKNAAFGLLKDLNEYIAAEEERLASIERDLSNLKHLQKTTDKMKTLTDKIRQGLDTDTNSAKFNTLREAVVYLPKPDDVKGIIVALAGLQNTYNISSAELANGQYKGFNLGKLSAEECLDIGLVLANSGFYRLSIEWINTAREVALNCIQSKGECFHKQQLVEDVNQILPRIYNDFIMMRTETMGNIEEIVMKGAPSGSFIKTEDWKRLRDTNSCKYFGKESLRNFEIMQKFETLCSAGDTRKGGFCTEKRNRKYGYFEKPRRVELINKSPLIIMLHDVVDSRYIDFLTKLQNMLSRSAILQSKGTNSKETIESDLRTSKTFWVSDYELGVAKRVNDILEDQTGFRLTKESSEKIQLVNYGIGGHYKPHHDYLPNVVPGSNRLATMLIYLNDVELGGSTVFPLLDIAVAPVKGSVLIFVNLDKNANGITSTFHGGCPVFLGCKWIANKWVRVNGQDPNFTEINPSVWRDVLSI